MNNESFVYMYSTPFVPGDYESGWPFYIGKGRGNRWKPESHTIGLTDTGRIIKCLGVENVIVTFIYSDLSDNRAIELEKELIAHYGRLHNGTGILTNMTRGEKGKTSKAKQTLHIPPNTNFAPATDDINKQLKRCPLQQVKVMQLNGSKYVALPKIEKPHRDNGAPATWMRDVRSGVLILDFDKLRDNNTGELVLERDKADDDTATK